MSNRNQNSPRSSTMGMVESWMHAALHAMERNPQPADQSNGQLKAFLTIKREWEYMMSDGVSLECPRTVARVKDGFAARKLDTRLIEAFDVVRDLFADPSRHAGVGAVYDRIHASAAQPVAAQ